MATLLSKKENRIGDKYYGTVDWQVGIADLDAEATTDTVVLTDIPSDANVTRCKLIPQAYFTGGSISAMTLQVGDGTDADHFVTATNVFDTTTLGTATGTQGAGIGGTPGTVTCTFTSTSDDVDAATAGSCVVRCHYERWEDEA